MIEAAQPTSASRLVAISGALAALAGLSAIIIRLFAPLVTVHVFGPSGSYVTNRSIWEVTSGFIGYPLGLAALGLCLVCLLAIGYGAYAFGLRHAMQGRLLLWGATALLALVVALAVTPLVDAPDAWWRLAAVSVVAPYLLPCLGLALFASGAAAASAASLE